MTEVVNSQESMVAPTTLKKTAYKPRVLLGAAVTGVWSNLNPVLAQVFDLRNEDSGKAVAVLLDSWQPEAVLLDEHDISTEMVDLIAAICLEQCIPIIRVVEDTDKALALAAEVKDAPVVVLTHPLNAPALLSTVNALLSTTKVQQRLLIEARMLDVAAEAYAAVDSQWRITYLNHAAERATGKSLTELQGQNLWEAFPEARGTEFEASYRRAMREREEVFIESAYAPKNSWYQVRVVPLPDGGLGFHSRKIQEQKNVEFAAEATERRLRLFLEHARDYALVLMDADGHVTEWLGGAEHVTGWTAESMRGRHIQTLFSENDRRAGVALADLKQAVDLGSVETARWHVKRDGSVFFTAGVTRAIWGIEGQLEGFGWIFRDITKRKQAEMALQASEQRLLFVMDAMPQKIFTAAANGNITFANSAWLSYTGVSFEELRDWKWTEIVHPDDLSENVRVWSHAIETGQPFELEQRFRSTEGENRWHLSRALPKRGTDGKVEMWVGSNTDVHHIKQTEAELAQKLESERLAAERLGQVARAAQALNAELSLQGIAEILVEESRHILKSHQAVVSLTDGEMWEQAITTVSLSDKYADYRNYEARPDGSGIYALVCQNNKPMRLNQADLEAHPAWKGFGGEKHRHPPMNGWLAVPLVTHDGRNLGLIQLSDKLDGEYTADDEAILTQLAVIASVGIENARLYEALREQDQRKDEFLAMLAHELRNPLAPLRSGMDLLMRPIAQDNTTHIHNMMDRQLKHLACLVDDLMDISRVSRGKIELHRERVAVGSIVEAAVESSQPLLTLKRHRFTYHLPEKPLWIEGDVVRLTQVLCNILNNAAKYTPEGGEVSLSVQCKRDSVVIRVADNGIGISATELSRVFDLFTQVDQDPMRTQCGLGIGLALVQKLVLMHGGQVMAESPGLGEGSVFTVALPLIAPIESPISESPAVPASEEVPPRQVLVVDDNKEAADALGMLLKSLGHEAKVLYLGQDALNCIKDYTPDLIILDISLPDISGYEVAQRLRQHTRLSHTIIAAFSGWSTSTHRNKVRESGFDCDLTKPLDIAKLKQLLEIHHRGDNGAE